MNFPDFLKQTKYGNLAHVLVEKIIEMAHEKGAYVLIDGAQACAHIKPNLQKRDVDFYVLGLLLRPSAGANFEPSSSCGRGGREEENEEGEVDQPIIPLKQVEDGKTQNEGAG